MIPRNLAEVAQLAFGGHSFDRCLWNFLDGFYAAPSFEAISGAPLFLASHVDSGDIKDAYLAAVAEELARQFHLHTPDWIWDPKRNLHSPWFASDLQSIRGLLILESPPGFRSRNLFVSENALARA